MKGEHRRRFIFCVLLPAVLAFPLWSFAAGPETSFDPTKYSKGTREIPTPQKGYHDRYTSMTASWNDAGQGYYDPTQYTPPNVPEADGKKNCVECHEKYTPSAVEEWKASKHGKNGIDCSVCHGTHPQVFMPLPKTCGTCHPGRVEQHFAGKHGRYGFYGAHTQAGRRGAQYEEMKEMGCGTCHSVALKCDSCHTRHRFDPAEARRPEACATCHMGPDHAQTEYYESSKHGVIASVEGKIFEEGGRAPGCVTCHMSRGTHDVSQGITLGGSSQGKFIGNNPSGDAYHPDPNGINMNEISPDDFKRERDKMLAICKNCHSERFARHKLNTADGIKIATDGVTGEAYKIIQGLKDDGLLTPMPSDRIENPAPFPKGKDIWLTGHELYEQVSGIEAKFFHMYKFYNIHAWKGAYHMSPDWSHWYGNAPLKLMLSEIWEDASMIRRLNALEKKQGINWKDVSPVPDFMKPREKPDEVKSKPIDTKDLIEKVK